MVSWILTCSAFARFWAETISLAFTPMKLIAYATARDSQRASADEPIFGAGPIPTGKSGILLVFKQGETEHKERLSVDIEEKELESSGS